MNQSILLVSPLTEHISAVCVTLQRFGLRVFQAENVHDAKAGLTSHSPAFLLIDCKIQRFEEVILETAGNLYSSHPYILASGNFQVSAERAAILKLGADICIGAPVDAEEVCAVVQAAQRREQSIAQHNHGRYFPNIRHKDLVIDPFERYVTMQGTQIDLTVKEFDILYLLARRRGTVLTKDEIYQAVWNTSVGLDASIVMNHISSIRRKLGLNCRDGNYIRTVFGVGYSFGELVEV